MYSYVKRLVDPLYTTRVCKPFHIAIQQSYTTYLVYSIHTYIPTTRVYKPFHIALQQSYTTEGILAIQQSEKACIALLVQARLYIHKIYIQQGYTSLFTLLYS